MSKVTSIFLKINDFKLVHNDFTAMQSHMHCSYYLFWTVVIAKNVCQESLVYEDKTSSQK